MPEGSGYPAECPRCGYETRVFPVGTLGGSKFINEDTVLDFDLPTCPDCPPPAPGSFDELMDPPQPPQLQVVADA